MILNLDFAVVCELTNWFALARLWQTTRLWVSHEDIVIHTAVVYIKVYLKHDANWKQYAI